MRAAYALACLTLFAGCTPAVDPASAQQALVGGTTDSGDAGVVVLYVVDGENAYLCSASVIAPRVLLTAAHCVSDQLHSASTKFYAYPGNDFSQATQADLLAVRSVRANPAWDPQNLSAGHDVGIVVLQDPIAIAPLPIRRAPLTDADMSSTLRLVGFGAVDGSDDGTGIKRDVQTPLTNFDPVMIHFTDPMHLTCNGDSGGPALLLRDGVEEIAGITSYGDSDCKQFGADTRVDAETSFIDTAVAAIDTHGESLRLDPTIPLAAVEELAHRPIEPLAVVP